MERRLPPWLATSLVCLTGLLVAAAVAALEGEPWLRGAPMQTLGVALGFLIGAVGCGMGFRAHWTVYPARDELPEDTPADDWWHPSLLGWVFRAIWSLPHRFVPPPGKGPTRQLPACSLALRVIAQGTLIFHAILALGIFLLILWLVEFVRWATQAA